MIWRIRALFGIWTRNRWVEVTDVTSYTNRTVSPLLELNQGMSSAIYQLGEGELVAGMGADPTATKIWASCVCRYSCNSCSCWNRTNIKCFRGTCTTVILTNSKSQCRRTIPNYKCHKLACYQLHHTGDVSTPRRTWTFNPSIKSALRYQLRQWCISSISTWRDLNSRMAELQSAALPGFATSAYRLLWKFKMATYPPPQ